MKTIRITTAGAGSGKTTELTNRMHGEIAARRVRPQGIIAATFTKAAAAELEERVRRKLLAEKLFAETKGLEESLIGTVHSICQRLIGRFAFEAGLSPRVEVLDELAVHAVLGESVEGVCALADVRRMEGLSRRLNQFDSRTRQSRWKAQVNAVIKRAVENAIPPEELPAMAERSITELAAYLPAQTADDLDALLKNALSAAESGVDRTVDGTKVTAGALDQVKQAARELASGHLSWASWAKLATVKAGKKSAAAFAPVQNIAARVEQHPQLRGDLESYIRDIFGIAARAMNRYRERKEERGQLDFNDLEARALELLDHPQVQEVIRDEYDLLLVDEFQDTSPMQLALFLKLAALVNVQSIWVGDVKQAIYGFRGSDPELVNSVVRLIGDRSVLDKSYRTQPELCPFFNSLFAPAFASSHHLKAEEVELAPARSHDDKLPIPLELWLLSSGTQMADGEPRSLSADNAAHAIAEGLQRLLAAPPLVHDKAANRLRVLCKRDVAVLCRTNDFGDKVAAALAARGVPVTRESSGLLNTPEVTFAMACLKRLADPSDTLAAATIVALAAGLGTEEWLQHRLEWLADKNNDGDRWGIEGTFQDKTLQALEKARPNLASASPAEMLDEALAVGNAFGSVTAWGPGEARAAQRRANLEALRGLAVRYEGLCRSAYEPATVAGLILWLQSLDKDPIAVDASADGVQIFTYHGAKGLEWPVVICTELDKEPWPRLWDEVVVVDGEAFDPLDPLHGRRLRFWPWPFGASDANGGLGANVNASPVGKAAEAAAHREDLRLLYVGFTRARDQLILASRHGKEPNWPNRVLGDGFAGPFNAVVRAETDGEALFFKTRMVRKTIVPPQMPDRPEEPADHLTWFAVPREHQARPPASVSPSTALNIQGMRVGRTLKLGDRLGVRGRCDEVVLGNALHAVFAAIFEDAHPRTGISDMARGLIDAHELSGTLECGEVIDAAARLRTVLQEQFGVRRTMVEAPFEYALGDGTRVTGFIDLAAETGTGWMIVDHKSFQGSVHQCEQRALDYASQLAHYRRALEASGAACSSHWIHFPVAGVMVEVVAD